MAPEAAELSAIRAAAAGLEYPSESDSPFDAFMWNEERDRAAKSARGVVLAHVSRGAILHELTSDAFFAELVTSDDGERFGQLRTALETNLAELTIFRVLTGSPRVDVYLIGKLRDPAGGWAGLHTVSVET
jgi:hypothetical protein